VSTAEHEFDNGPFRLDIVHSLEDLRESRRLSNRGTFTSPRTHRESVRRQEVPAIATLEEFDCAKPFSKLFGVHNAPTSKPWRIFSTQIEDVVPKLVCDALQTYAANADRPDRASDITTYRTHAESGLGTLKTNRPRRK
jgi:hypothetical protein